MGQLRNMPAIHASGHGQNPIPTVKTYAFRKRLPTGPKLTPCCTYLRLGCGTPRNPPEPPRNPTKTRTEPPRNPRGTPAEPPWNPRGTPCGTPAEPPRNPAEWSLNCATCPQSM